MIIREAVDKINPAPEEMKTCNSFIWDVHEFMEAVEGSGFVAIPHMLLLFAAIILFYITY